MKKIYLALPLLALAMTACDPSEFDLGSPDATTPASTIEGAITINQVDENGNPAADGNYFTYTTSPSLPVQIYNYNSSGQEVPLAHGAYGSFSIIPKRGEDSNQTFYIRLANHDGSMSEISKTYSVYVPTELPQEIEYLASNSGSKKWIWDTSVNGQAWGNLGYACGSGENFFVNGSDQWWGCGPEMLWYNGEGGQYGHTDGDDAMSGEGDANAYMTFDEDGKITTYDANGTILRSANFEVNIFSSRQDVGGNPWNIGTLTTTEPAIMYPYMINGGGTKVTDLEILGLTSDQLVLVYPGTAAPGAWAEATFWRFMKK